jgi:hypothetical protein
MMPVVLPNDALAIQLPQPRIMITTRRDQVRRVCAKRAVPDPSLVAAQRRLEREGVGIAICGGGSEVGRGLVRVRLVDGPDAGGVVGAAGSEVADVRGEEDVGDVGSVSEELADGDEGGDVGALDHAPDVDVALDIPHTLAVLAAIGSYWGQRTALFPAHSIDPSLATVTLLTDTSSSGISWWLHLFSPRSQMRTLPPRSQLISSP